MFYLAFRAALFSGDVILTLQCPRLNVTQNRGPKSMGLCEGTLSVCTQTGGRFGLLFLYSVNC